MDIYGHILNNEHNTLLIMDIITRDLWKYNRIISNANSYCCLIKSIVIILIGEVSYCTIGSSGWS